jgi:aralkylamine N-acetyltransferase
MSYFENIQYKEEFLEDWIDETFDLFNMTELKRNNKMRLLKAIKARYAVVTAWNDNRLVGIGTVISDGVMYASIFDLVVHPEFQKNGVGKKIMEKLMESVPGTSVHLTSTFGNEEFYKKLGFKKHKTAMAKYTYKSEYLES